MTRSEVLDAAKRCVCGDREQDYGSPERNFATIAAMWEIYLSGKNVPPGTEVCILPEDVAAMLALLKIARISSGHAKNDNWIDLAGYAACGGELQAEDICPEPAAPHYDGRLWEYGSYSVELRNTGGGHVVGLLDLDGVTSVVYGETMDAALDQFVEMVDQHLNKKEMENMNFPDHPVIRNMERTGYPDGKIPEEYFCPNCGDPCKKIYTVLGHEAVGCEKCVGCMDAEEYFDE